MSYTMWEDFCKYAVGRKVVLIGIGVWAHRFFSLYGKKIQLYAAVDNDKRKQGVRLNKIIGTWPGCGMDKLVIQSLETVVENEMPDEFVFLIASGRYGLEISHQLEQIGIKHIFSIKEMDEKISKESKINVWEKSINMARKYSLLPLEKNKIVFIIGTQISHGISITNQLINRGLDIVWIVGREYAKVPHGVRAISQYDVDSCFCELETAHVLIINGAHNFLSFFIKRQAQYIVNIKHWSSITLKKFGAEDKSFRDTGDFTKSLQILNDTDYILSGSKFDEETCKSGLLFCGKFKRVGSPRSDAMFNESLRKKVYQHYGIVDSVRTLLYAPTWRRVHGSDFVARNICGELHFDALKQVLEKRFGGKWWILVRLHPNEMAAVDKISERDYVINASSYDDGQELASAADAMLSDYSSIMFEPAFVEKPVFLYAPDREEYVAEERGFLIDYDTLPFAIAETNEQLVDNIMNFDQEKYKHDLKEFFDKYGVHEDGHASERAAEFILKLMNEDAIEKV